MASPIAVKMSNLPALKRQHLLAELYVILSVLLPSISEARRWTQLW